MNILILVQFMFESGSVFYIAVFFCLFVFSFSFAGDHHGYWFTGLIYTRS